MITSEVIMHQQ